MEMKLKEAAKKYKDLMEKIRKYEEQLRKVRERGREGGREGRNSCAFMHVFDCAFLYTCTVFVFLFSSLCYCTGAQV